MQNEVSVNEGLSFINFLAGWQRDRPSLRWAEIISDPHRTAILSVDVINGFCRQGALASPRVAQIVHPVVTLLSRYWSHGGRSILLAQDTHDPQATEFAQWPPHCVRGTSEAETVSEIRALPFYDQITVIPKNSINAALEPAFQDWLLGHLDLDTFIVVGDCTDLCTYQLAMYLRLSANDHQQNRRVIVPIDCVDTYDFPVEAARQAGALPHPAEIIHPLFLYHMALNGIEVVKEIAE